MADDPQNALGRRPAVEELVARYNWAWDHRDVEGVVACFAADGVFVDAAGQAHHGGEGIRQFVEASFAQFGRMRHMTMSHLVGPRDDGHMKHRCYVLFVSHPDGRRVLDTGEYEDEIVWHAGQPIFQSRAVSFD